MSHDPTNIIDRACDAYAQGLVIEPRVLSNTFLLPIAVGGGGFLVVGAAENAFRNGEPFPMRFTHMIVSARKQTADAASLNLRDLQMVGLRLRRHDGYYFSEDFAAVPLYANKPTTNYSPASEESYAPAVSWTFEEPIILGRTEGLRIEIAPRNNALFSDGDWRAGIAFHAFGVVSQKPYLLASDAVIGAGSLLVPPQLLTNEAPEPICLTDMVCYTGGDDFSSAFDVFDFGLRIQRVGRTSKQWLFNAANLQLGDGGPVNPLLHTTQQWTPMPLLGVTGNNAFVHQFPDEGFKLDPAEEIQIELLNNPFFDEERELLNPFIDVGLCGYIYVS